jgi:hypothetical protein
MRKRTKLPPLDEIPAQLPEEPAPRVLMDLVSLDPTEKDPLYRTHYCGQFNDDKHGAGRLPAIKVATARALSEAWPS